MTFLKIVGATQPKAKVAEFIDKCTILQIYHYYGGYFYGYLFVCVCVCLCTCTHVYHDTHVECRGQPWGVHSFLLPCGVWGLNTVHQE